MLIIFYIFLAIRFVVGVYLSYIDKRTVYLTEKSIILNNGDDYQIELLPKNLDYYEANKYIYESENPNIAKVNTNGLVTGLNAGKTKIIVASSDGTSEEVEITVKEENRTEKC